MIFSACFTFWVFSNEALILKRKEAVLYCSVWVTSSRRLEIIESSFSEISLHLCDLMLHSSFECFEISDNFQRIPFVLGPLSVLPKQNV